MGSIDIILVNIHNSAEELIEFISFASVRMRERRALADDVDTRTSLVPRSRPSCYTRERTIECI